MTEEEWLQSETSFLLLHGLAATFSIGRTRAGRRRLRLHSCACLRRAWNLLEPESRELVERLEAVCLGREPESYLKSLRQYADDRSVLHWYANDWDRYLRLAVAAAYGANSSQVEGANQTETNVVLAWLMTMEPRFVGKEVERHQAVKREYNAQVTILRDIFGNPFRPLSARKFPPEARGLAEAWLHGDLGVLPVLIDALADLGEDAAVEHLRQPLHVKGCHVIDWVLGR